MEDSIKGFTGEYRWLSNFYMCPVMWNGLLFKSSEAAYQAAKSNDPKVWTLFTTLSPYQSKRKGRTIEIREDWNEVRVDVMKDIVGDKFLRNKDLAEKLINTEDRYLEETNWWGDKFWGICNDEGINMLGKILMDTRRKLKDIQ